MSDPTPMSAEEVRVAIAEACGITVEPCTCAANPWRDAATKKHIRNYPEDLNAMASAVDYLRNANRFQYLTYGVRLDNLVARYNSLPEREAYHGILSCDAPAEMRAEAFLFAVERSQP